ncbi:MAG: hypothetical protein KF849_12910 [Rhizobiaceae bacterium]|nr:hypothetical protein [Rhizobiaceae bacterium]
MIDDSSLGAVCLIRSRPVIVSEAYLGGIVAQPLQGAPTTVAIANLASKSTLVSARELLRAKGKT